MTTYPLPTLACTIDAAGITAPSYADILASLQASFRSIYGSDAYLEPDSQDGQLLAVFASAINDSNAATIAAYNAYSPATAQGNGLSVAVKINGIIRHVPTNSTVDVVIVGTFGTEIVNGIVEDALTQRWALPALVTIPISGTDTVTATAVDVGALAAEPDTITRIVTPTRGWVSVNNPGAAVIGAPVESDAALRQRQGISAALPANSPIAGIVAAIADLTGVEQLKVYENDTGSVDADGIPAHSISAVVLGGDSQEVADAIGSKKTPGTGTYGTTSETYEDPRGLPIVIDFYRPTDARIIVEIDLTALYGWVVSTVDVIKAAVAAYINAGLIGQDVLFTKLFSPANLPGTALDPTFDLTAIRIAKHPASPTAANVVVAFNELASCDVADITVNVT